MSNKGVVSVSSFFKPLISWVVLVLILSEYVTADWEQQSFWGLRPLVKKNQRTRIISNEYGEVSEARVTDGNEVFQLHFITLEPNSLFLPVVLHYDMVFYVQTGSGKLSYLDEDEKEHRRLRRGDVHRLRSGASFFIQCNLESERQKLRIIAIFDNPEYNFNDPASGPYSSIRDLVLGFGDNVLSAMFKAPEAVIEEIRNGTRPAAIIHGMQKQKSTMWKMENELVEDMYNIFDFSNKHKKSKLFNILGEDPDFKNCNGWSATVDGKKYRPLEGSKYGIFMVNLSIGSMMGPHWNPVATEIALVVQGKGMVRVVCSRMANASMCQNSRYLVEEGDVVAIPRFHPMAQMAFNNETFVFMGFSTSIRRNHPQYLAGKASVLQTLDRRIIAASFGTNVSTFDKFFAHQDESVILACVSCAEEEWTRMVEDIEERRREKEREEEEARRKEEAKRKEEEAAEAQRRREEEEVWRRWQEEEERKRQEQERESQEQQRREQEERERQEQEERERQEQEQQEQEERERQEQQRQEQEERERQEQEERERQEQEREEEEAWRKWQEEEERKRQEQEERERQEQEQQEQEERERQEQQQREQEEREQQQREQERAQEAEREREEQASREEEAAQGQEQGSSEGQGQWEEGHGKQVPEEERRQEEQVAKEAAAAQEQGQWGEHVLEEKRGQQAEAMEEEEGTGQGPTAESWKRAHSSGGRRQEETGQSPLKSATAQEEQGSTQGWARRILEKPA